MEPKVGIVIVNYNGEKYQNKCIESIYGLEYSNIEIVVVDSCSKDNSIKKLRDSFPEVVVLEQIENVGVAKGNNIGIQYCLKQDVEYVLLLNNDVELDSMLLVNLMKEAGERIVTVPKIYYYEPKDLIWFAGGDMRWDKGESNHIGIGEYDRGQYGQKKKVNYASTCCMLIHRSIFEQIGLIDETVFMYFDDTDFCVRLIDEGYTILFVPDAKMWHKVSGSAGADSKIQVYYNTRNKFYFMKKYKDRLKLSAYFFTYSKLLVKFLISPIYKKNDRYIARAYYDFRKGIMGRREWKN